MAKPHPDVTEAELAVLRGLWDGGPATVRRLADGLYPGGGASAAATVQKLLERLETKGCAGRKAGSVPQVFEARIDREALIGRRARALADDLCGGSMASLLSHLVDAQPLGEGERRALRAFLDQLDAGDDPSGGRK